MSDSRINKAKQEILQQVIKAGGTMSLDMVLNETATWSIPISRVKAVEFKSEFNINKILSPSLVRYWNDHIAEIKEAIGVEQYFELVKDDNDSEIGILAFYDDCNEEIKTKHFTKWVELNEFIKTKDLLEATLKNKRKLNNDLFSKICVNVENHTCFISAIMSLLGTEQELDENNISWNFFNPNYLRYCTDINKWTISRFSANLQVISVEDFRKLLLKSEQKKHPDHEQN